MGWTLGKREPEDPALAEAFFCSLGRALYIATEFEQKCHYLLRLGILVTRVEADPKLTLTDLIAPSKVNKTIGPTLKDLGALGKLKEEDLALLDAGRVARNYIAHQAASVGPTWNLNAATILKALDTLKENVLVLAKADTLISAWLHGIGEKEPPARYLVDSYPDRVISWIFEGA